MEKDIKDDVKELVDAAKKVGQTAKELGTEEIKVAKEKSKTAATKVKRSAKKIKSEICDIFTNTQVHTYVQAYGKEISEDVIISRIKDAYRAENPDKEVESLNIYIKPEDNKVYYVVNNNFAGEINIE